MAPSHQQRLAEVNGVVIPSKLPAGHQPLISPKNYPTAIKLDNARIDTCPICGHAGKDSRSLRVHFVACVKRNGNPTGARWDDNLSFRRRAQLQKQKQANMHASGNTHTFTTSDKPADSQTIANQHSERSSRYHARLAAVNGVVIPSKLAQGETLVRRNFNSSEGCKYPCAICGGLHKKKYHVQSHFATCVETNGNPMGARWDDACQKVRSRARPASTIVSTAPLPSQTQQYQPAGYPITDAGFDFALVDPLLLYGYSNSNPYQFPSPSIGFEHFSTGMEHPDPELMASSPYYMCNNTAFTTL